MRKGSTADWLAGKIKLPGRGSIVLPWWGSAVMPPAEAYVYWGVAKSGYSQKVKIED